MTYCMVGAVQIIEWGCAVVVVVWRVWYRGMMLKFRGSRKILGPYDRGIHKNKCD
jgi:hypothetical protein